MFKYNNNVGQYYLSTEKYSPYNLLWFTRILPIRFKYQIIYENTETFSIGYGFPIGLMVLFTSFHFIVISTFFLMTV